MSADALRGLRESVWLDQGKYEQAEGRYQQVLASKQAGITSTSEVYHALLSSDKVPVVLAEFVIM